MVLIRIVPAQDEERPLEMHPWNYPTWGLNYPTETFIANHHANGDWPQRYLGICLFSKLQQIIPIFDQVNPTFFLITSKKFLQIWLNFGKNWLDLAKNWNNLYFFKIMSYLTKESHFVAFGFVKPLDDQSKDMLDEDAT